MTEVHELFTKRAIYGPERLKQLCSVFDAAWDVIAPAIGDGAEVEKARTTLANLILSLPCSEIADATSIKNAALGVLAASGKGPSSGAQDVLRKQLTGRRNASTNPDQGKITRCI